MSAVALLASFVCLGLLGRVAADCQPCDDYFNQLKNRTGGSSCRCIYVPGYVHSAHHPQIIADCRNLAQLPRFSSICNMSDVRSINLGYNSIQELGKGAFSAISISDRVITWSEAQPELILSNNDISVIHPEAFGAGLENKLSHLYLQGNKLESIPEALFRLRNLTILDLSKNQIESSGIHEGFTFGKLSGLDLSFNKLTEFPSALCASPELQTLRLHNNEIKGDLSEYLKDLENCRRLLYLSWSQPTMTCKFAMISSYANNSECKEMTVRFGRYERMVCDPKSSSGYVGERVERVLRLELSKVCPYISASLRTFSGWLSKCLIFTCLMLSGLLHA